MGLANGPQMPENMKNEHWEKFYQEKKAPGFPSSFSQFFLSRNIPGETLVDLGSGNGRDTYNLREKYKATGIDPACKPEDWPNAVFIQDEWENRTEEIERADIVYSRFFLHTIPTAYRMRKLINSCNGYFAAEARAEGDVPVIYTDHKRHYVNGETLIVWLALGGFEILYYEKGRGMAKYLDEDPLVLRVIAKRKNEQ